MPPLVIADGWGAAPPHRWPLPLWQHCLRLRFVGVSTATGSAVSVAPCTVTVFKCLAVRGVVPRRWGPGQGRGELRVALSLRHPMSHRPGATSGTPVVARGLSLGQWHCQCLRLFVTGRLHCCHWQCASGSALPLPVVPVVPGQLALARNINLIEKPNTVL